jgi:hypothetical protein
MNRTFTQFLVLALLVVTAFSACTKSTDALTITKDNLVGTYTIISIKAKASSNPEQDVTTQILTPCQIDDQVILRNDYTSIYVDAGTKCSIDGGYSDDWGFNGNLITVAGEDFIIRSLTKTTLVLEQTNTVAGLLITETFTYSRN